MEKRLPTQSEIKYRNARISLLVVLIVSAINFILLSTTNVYYVFSLYLPNVFIQVGMMLSQQAGDNIFYIVSIVFGIIILVPFLLAYIFSKNKTGWMITALVLFSIDSFFLFIDMFNYLAVGQIDVLIDVAVHVVVIVELALGVKYGKIMQAERMYASKTNQNNGSSFSFFKNQSITQNSEAVDKTEEAETVIPITRSLTITRKKSFVGMVALILCYVDGKQVCALKNGETQTITVPQSNFELSAMFSNGSAIGSAIVPAGGNVNYEVSVKMGFSTADIIITKKDDIVL